MWLFVSSQLDGKVAGLRDTVSLFLATYLRLQGYDVIVVNETVIFHLLKVFCLNGLGWARGSRKGELLCIARNLSVPRTAFECQLQSANLEGKGRT
jgi:hypothetical protein